MRLLIISLLFLVSTAHAVKCKQQSQLLYGDREIAKGYPGLSDSLSEGETTAECPSCVKFFTWARSEKDSFGYFTSDCWKQQDKDGCFGQDNVKNGGLTFDLQYCICNEAMCNEESGDLKQMWKKLFYSKAGDPDQLKCYSHFKILDKSQKLDENLKKLDHIDPRELPCRGVKQCMVNLISINDLKSIIMGCADVKGKSDGCIIADDKMNATCYCSSNNCFSPEAAEGMMEEFARTGKVNLPPQGGNTNTGNPMPGGSLGAGGAVAYSNGSPNIFTSFSLFFFVALVILIL